mgnify:CR=1 FL=1
MDIILSTFQVAMSKTLAKFHRKDTSNFRNTNKKAEKIFIRSTMNILYNQSIGMVSCNASTL